MKKVLMAFILISALMLSYVRENMFLILNGAIQRTNAYKANTDIPDFLLNDYTTSELVQLKYGMTLFYVVIFMALTLAAVHIWFNSKNRIKLLVKIYAGLIATTVVLFLGHQATKFEVLYFLFVKLSHLLQGPILVFIVLLSFHFLPSNQKSVKNVHET